ncbi:MAG: DNA mismatch repair endonuclease MutL [Prevotella sp.]|nr:DNA mismatch repair endonuclease MutL [Paraprevotella sp.]MDY4408975.1 DNA mismatch repair endonuclease MutL [Prevotella sp.]
MSDIIQLLPDSVANQIAAGEVIQRPASVIKELVENAVDAGASNINVLVTDAGRTSIQVIDDGKGMSETDARLSFERHATSKIKEAADLFSLHTMGFRGEALASIAAVAQVELKTRTPDEELGTHLSIAASKVTGQEAVSCPIGSNFSVENIFYNVPARRKFLKSNATELNNILIAFERIVLVNPHINFTLHSNGVEMYNLKKGSMRQRIVDVLGKKINQDLLPVGVETTVCNLTGFVGKPESARKKTPHQYFFVNGRYMKHPYFHKAVMTAFERMIPVGEQVPYFIYFDVKPENIDVNIHPTKTEIKFENEQTIWQILTAAVKDAIGKFSGVTSIDFDTIGKPDIPVFNPSNIDVQAPKVDFNSHYNPFKEPQYYHNAKSNALPEAWEDLYEGIQTPNQHTDNLPELLENDMFEVNSSQQSFDDKSPIHYQYKGKYIMTAVKSGLLVVDQYRAHIRVLYDKYMMQISGNENASQKVLFPEVISFTPSETILLDSIMTDLEKLGFDLTSLGGGSYSVSGVPAGIEGVDYVKLLKSFVDKASDCEQTSLTSDIHAMIALKMARSAAIPYGQILGNAEMENLINELFASSDVNHTPDGKLIISILKQSDIDNLFV